jgi:hypothetical protein
MSRASHEHWEKHDVKGRIYVLDLNDANTCAKELKVTPSESFNPDTFAPHGISVWEDKEKGEW